MSRSLLPIALGFAACSEPADPPRPEASLPIHLEAHLQPKATETAHAARDKAKVQAVSVTVPSTLRASVRIPADGRLDLAMGIPTEGATVTFRVTAETTDTSPEILIEHTQEADWMQHGLSLAHLAGKDAELVFETVFPSTVSPSPGAAALWGAPTLSGQRPAGRPNILFYVIDGGGADLMSLYGYERPTTPNIDALAEEGVVFEAARTSSAWTKPSTASFMTSLHHSVLGGFTTNEDRIPEDVVTMAEHFQAAGYQTAVFTSNPFAGSMSGLESGVDLFRDQGVEANTASSIELHDDFWHWREDWPGGPWWAHIQTTDVHEPHRPIAPYAERYASTERRDLFEQWWAEVHQVQGVDRDTVLGRYREQLAQVDVDPRTFFQAQWDLYDETMTQNDATLGALVARLKAKGEWNDTLLILASDHGHPAGSFSRFGRGLIEPAPADWEGALADSYRTRVPLVLTWPGHLPSGVRIKEPVSMLDVLPTVLELAGLPPAEVQQGRSLVSLMTGTGSWESRPLVIEQVQAHVPTGEMVGHIELIDGSWAASLEVMPESLEETYQATDSLVTAGGWRAARPHRPSTPPLLLYNIVADPFCLQNVNAEHPDLVAEYTLRLQALWAEHQALAERFTHSDAGEHREAGEAGTAQIEALRVLGYVE